MIVQPGIEPPATQRRRGSALARFALREPLVHFLAGGGLIFLAFYLLGDPGPDVLTITQEQVDAAIRQRAELASRPLSSADRAAIVDSLIDEEVLVREAYRRGIDRNDAALRTRLVDKMRFLLVPEPPAPSREQLAAYLQAHADRYRTSAGLPPLDDLLPDLKQQWLAEQRATALQQCLDGLRKQYHIQRPK